jgi:hypothetical protein
MYARSTYVSSVRSGKFFEGRASPEPSPSLSESILVDSDALLDGVVRGQVIVFGIKLAVEPAGRQRFIMHLFLSVCNHWERGLPRVATRGFSVLQGFDNLLALQIDNLYLMWSMPHNLFSRQDFLFDQAADNVM